MDWELIRLALGAFLTSAGFGGAAALGAAVLAYRGILYRAETDRSLAAETAARQRSLAREADTRQRWWEALIWLSERGADLPMESKVKGLAALTRLASTEEQVILLDAIRAKWENGEGE